MSRDFRWPPTTVPAPRRAVGWTAETGFLYDLAKRDELIEQGRIVLEVTDPDPTPDPADPGGEPFVADVEATAPLHAAVRIDRDIAHLRARLDHLTRIATATQRYVEDLHMRLIGATEDAQQRFIANTE